MSTTPRRSPCPWADGLSTCQALAMPLEAAFGAGGGVERVHYHPTPYDSHVLSFEISVPPPTCP